MYRKSNKKEATNTETISQAKKRLSLLGAM